MWVYDVSEVSSSLCGPLIEVPVKAGAPDSSSAPDLLVFLPGLSVLVFQLRV